MEMQVRAKAAMEMINAQVQKLGEIHRQAQAAGDTTFAFDRLKRWKQRTVNLLSQQVNTEEAQKLDRKHPPGRERGLGSALSKLEREINTYSSFLTSLAEHIMEYPEEFFDVEKPMAGTRHEGDRKSAESISTGPKTVFVIHGHDKANVSTLRELLNERWQLNPIVLANKPGKGRTIIEKFEEEAKSASYAIALLTPDDVVKETGGKYAQARPNVTFELGWFYGRLGRDKVCILFKQGTKIHSDLDGISRIEFHDVVTEKVGEIETELKAAGLLPV